MMLADNRLNALPEPIFGALAPPSGKALAWPTLEGQVVILFTSRVGSTLLCNEIERTRPVGRVGETYNEANLRRFGERRGISSIEQAMIANLSLSGSQGWFVAKAGLRGLCVAERYGAMEHYLNRTQFIFLFRRDLAAQAISLRTAEITGQFHSNQVERRDLGEADYDEADAVKAMHVITVACTKLEKYLDAADRPTYILFYEDFKSGDFSTPNATFDAIGIPQRVSPLEGQPRTVSPVTRSVSAEWIRRLRAAKDAASILDRYESLVERVCKRHSLL